MNNTLISQTEATLSKLSNVLNQLEHQEYIQPVETLSYSSIGQHVRHVIEFYQCLTSGQHSGKINYDERKRDKLIEESLEFATQCINKILVDLKTIDLKKTVILDVNYGNKDKIEITTTIEREIVYNIEHSIHHMALIKVGIKDINNKIILPDAFGIADSTILYQEQNHVHRNLLAKS